MGSGLVHSCKRKGRIKALAITPKETTLKLLEEIKHKSLMSPRYGFFIKKMIELIKTNRLHVKYLDTADPQRPDRYNSKTDTIEINPVTLELRAKSSFIHELFHAYQDWQRKAGPNSFVEAEAYLAENDYLFHCHDAPGLEAWLSIETDPKEKKDFLFGFNAPASLIKRISNADFHSHGYHQAVKLTAYNYIWATTFFTVSKRVLGVLSFLKRSAMDDNTVLRYRAFHLHRMQSLSNSQTLQVRIIGAEVSWKVSDAIMQFVGSSRYLIRKLWGSGKKAEAQALLSRTFEEFKHALQSSARIYTLDQLKPEIFDGIK
ncbi:MAG: hypothetical protein U9R38_02080 [Candidatus Margulisiibacteriota bacterium]|nr:hypothetical protein [Candidatus Margulisiibacteriota bacterium]